MLKIILLLLAVVQLGYSRNTSSYSAILKANIEKYTNSSLWQNVLVFDQGMDMNEVQSIIDSIFNKQSGRKGELSNNRYALLFKPDRYTLDIKVDYYMQIVGD